MGKRILILNGNPKEQSLCAGLTQAYETSAKNSIAGHDVRRLEL